MARAFFSRTATSAVSFFLPSSRSFVADLSAVVSFGSSLPRRSSSLLTLAAAKPFTSASASAAMAATAAFDSAVVSLAFLIAASVSSASASMATDVRVLAFRTSPKPSFSAVAVRPSASSTVFVAASILTCSSCFSSAMRFSFSSLSALRATSLACSREMPTCTLRRCSRSFLTPFAPPLRFLTMPFSMSVGTVNLNSPFA
mmetsp:Transcript_77982/g.200789  ORF Transcript_77982/g.200789 Transcript_77982/m.200789 type:complete len:201 (-) Transcript_77982:1271-1873(-)